MKRLLQQTEKILLSPYFGMNLFGIFCWMMALLFFGLIPVFSDPEHELFKAELFTLVTALFLLWSILNEFSEMLRPLFAWFAAAKIACWLAIPAAIIFLTVHNGIFQMRLEGIDSNLSCIPIIEGMYSILVLYEIANYLKNNIPHAVKFVKLKTYLHQGLVALLVFVNFWFCGYFVVSWCSWYRFIRTGFVD